MSLAALARSVRKPLDQKGFHHYLIPLLVFVILFGIGGAYFYIVSRAAGNGIEYQLGSDKGLCMDNNGGRSSIRNKVDIWGCNGSSAQAWTIQSIGSNRFLLHDAAGTCLDDVGDGGSGARVQTYGCNSRDHAQVWSWQNSQLENVYSHACVNDPGYSKTNGTQLIVYSCQGSSNEKWYEVSQGGGSTGGSSNASSGSTASRIIAAARQWNGVWYLYGGGHESYSTFHSHCPTVKASNGACEVDCSGLISMATDMALGTNWSWFVSGGVMQGSGSGHWHRISLSSVQPGDIVTAGDHVEFVDGGSGAYPHIATFGAHETGQRDGYQGPGHTFVYSTAYRYE